MQSGGGVQGGHGRNMVAGPPSSSASPSSSSSAVSTPQLGFDPMQQQQQQQRQTLQQQLLRNPEAREAMLAYQSGNLQGVLGTNVAQMQGQNRNQGFDQNMMNPVHQAYNQYAFQNQQKSGLGMQPQQQIRMGTVVPSSKDQKMQDSDQGQSQSQNQKQFVTPTSLGQLVQGGSNSVRPMSAPQAPQNMTMAAQLQAMQALALERNIDLSLPQNANLVAQLIPLMQARMQKANETSMTNDNSPRGNSSSDLGSAKTRQNIPPGHLGSTSNPLLVNNPGPGQVGQSQVQGPDHGQQLPPRQPAPVNSMNQGFMQQTNRSSSQLKLPSNFTKQQLHVLKAQILAFRRIKKGEKTLPNELIQAIAPPPLEAQTQPSTANAGAINVKSQSQPDDQTRRLESNDKELQAAAFTSGTNNTKREGHEENAATVMSTQKETPPVLPAKQEQEVELGVQKTSNVIDRPIDKGKSVISEPVTVPDNVQSKRPLQAGNPPQTKDSGPKKYHGPLFDFPFFTRKHDAFGSSMMINNNNNLPLAYDLKDLIAEEGTEVINKKRNESIEKINSLLAVNLERRRIRPDVVLRLQIEEKKLKLQDLQKRVRDGVDQNQQDIMAMPDRPYRKFIRLCERQRMDLNRQVQAAQRAIRDKQLKQIFHWRKKLLEFHWAIRDARTQRNRGVAKYHERMLREFSKRKDDDRSKRMEALKNNDVERYRQILLEQQTSMPGEAAERYEVLSSFLSQTEEYLQKLGSKITAAKNQQEVEEAGNAAAAAARAQGLSEEEVRAAASCAREEVMIRNRFSEMNAPQDSSSVSKYYTLAHAVNERVIRQPSMLRCGTLRDYQLVGLQWMLSLYNNKLNGILADEMGLGKTVQVMALIAYLMEFKSNYGPHLIIVPNAVLVNWKSELHNWLPNVSCIYYVGNKDQRTKLFSQEVLHVKFNVLVTTYEFVMYDRSKLSRVDWKYIVIDEAQRMKDRESVLARDLDRYRCQRRLLLTGTPLQNDLKELWSLLNLLLPEVFDNRKAFHDWFSKPFSKDVAPDGEDDWLETEKKVIIIHRLHQILEPFMLRRRVEDVEGSLPPKISIILRCKMSAIQGAIYDWIKSTGTIRVDPEDEKRKAQKNPMHQPIAYKPLNNKCMELRKACNHPLLNYPYFNDFSKDFLVRSCGKLWILDRILVKLQSTGHRVLLFSTMTKLLDILEEYLQWRRLVYRRIDGTTSLEDRESAIVDFNSPDTDCFIFLLSIRAAGRGLNLQTADTVIIYDPDPNPKNEEQAVARAHRIGQTREVKVIYMEAVVDKISSHEKEDNFKNGGRVDSDDDLAGKDRYIGSIESLIRNNIQQYKIDMADEVINAGRFDQRTTHEERRSTLESLLRDEERYQETVHDVPSLQEVNRMIARSEEEVELFDQMDEEFDWADEMTRYDQVPKWLRAGTREVNTTVARLSKKPPKHMIFTENIENIITDRRRGRYKDKKFPNYSELDDDIEEFYEATSEEVEDDETVDATETPGTDKAQSEDDFPAENNQYEYPRGANVVKLKEEGSSGSSSDSRISIPVATPSISSQKFGSLSALEARPGSRSRRLHDDLEEGEIAFSGDSHLEVKQSSSGTRDHDEVEDEQVLQPKIKRKRSIRLRPKQEKPSALHGGTSRLPFQADCNKMHVKTETEQKAMIDQTHPSLKTKKTPPNRKNSNKANVDVAVRQTRGNSISAPPKVTPERPKESGTKMSEAIQRRCKNVITKIQRRIDKEGQQIIPLLTDLWKKAESHGNNILDLHKIELRVERLDYNTVPDLIVDVQAMLKSGMQYFGFSHEVRSEARKVHDLFFDILKIAFPDTDFREARSALTFSSSAAASASGSSPRVIPVQPFGQPKRQKPILEVDPQPKSHPRPTAQRETRFGNNNTRDSTNPQDEPRPLTHPGELVICKKKRKDREKSAVKPGASVIRSPGQTRMSQSQQGWSNNQSPKQGSGSGSGGGVGWANPVKRMRTDAGKRRPSHM
ncbi:putative DNA helicase chromatin remodeling SNF2 family [Helianthus annuus]|uniref:DNA helicase chromatin remodeling SNF2 family n=1 Tax=Helianthus annuus TaxID=4232 RepID=A0A251V158_HELAN|nr:ATP-dependent helicase BRM [Helianthus annuus]KAF5811599.1 putative DNA helicase chromatin remodeling SNF2 family [Helianthus annuus]KAJ0590420.1 putative DNA helicase chromatin remodeling C3H-WRC/GRF family [Helianthus annuus]KAJ0932704.1 putative DNA helicase chromatin remodeling SNF2 family [Helianthus annuus]